MNSEFIFLVKMYIYNKSTKSKKKTKRYSKLSSEAAGIDHAGLGDKIEYHTFILDRF